MLYVSKIKELSRERTKVDSMAYHRTIIDSLRRLNKDSTNTKTVVKKQSFTELISDLMIMFIITIILIGILIIFIRYKCR